MNDQAAAATTEAYIPSPSSKYEAPSSPSISPIDLSSFLPNNKNHPKQHTDTQRTSSLYTSNQRKNTIPPRTHDRPQRELHRDERPRCRKHLMPQILGNFAPNHSEQTSWRSLRDLSLLQPPLLCSVMFPVIGFHDLPSGRNFFRCCCCFRKKLLTNQQKTSPNLMTLRT